MMRLFLEASVLGVGSTYSFEATLTRFPYGQRRLCLSTGTIVTHLMKLVGQGCCHELREPKTTRDAHTTVSGQLSTRQPRRSESDAPESCAFCIRITSRSSDMADTCGEALARHKYRHYMSFPEQHGMSETA